jgi:phospholipid/cholesterol/gamma-HCH transport system substrate-binding protein
MMETRNRNVAALGALVLGAALVLFWGFYYLIDEAPMAGGAGVHVLLADAGGLKRGDRVQLQGVEVGSVREVRLEGPGRVIATLRIADGVRVPADTRARVLGDVFGAHVVELEPGDALVRVGDGDTIRGFSAGSIPRLTAELGDAARTVLTRADALLAPEAVADVHALAAALPDGAAELTGAFAELRHAAASLRRSALGVEAAEPGAALGRAADRLEESALAFTAAAGQMERSLAALAAVLDKVDRGHGTLGRLVNDSSLYLEFAEAVREVRGLTADARENPRKFFGIKLF